MAGLGRLSPLRHAAVGVAVVGVGVLGLTGLVGARGERFDAKQVVVAPAGEDGVRIREVVDQDFGVAQRHGYERTIPNDFGVPIDVTASSPDAPAFVGIDQIGGETRIRIGDPDSTVSGQHRYVLAYTLPDARLSDGRLALDIIGTDETLTTERFEVAVTGLELAEPLCNVGASGTSGGCELVPDGDVYRAAIGPLEPGDGITIGGRITGRPEPVNVAEPPLPDRRADRRLPLALGMVGLGAPTAAAVYLLARRRGRNEVFAGGAADAAYGDRLPPPGAASRAPSDVRFVADARLGDLATTEFEPPRGVAPWLGAVVLRERIDTDTVSAWFSGLAADDVIDLTQTGDAVTLQPGPRFASAEPEDATLLGELFSDGGPVELGTYDRQFASVWTKVRARQERLVAESGYWKHKAPGGGGCSGLGGLDPRVLIGGFVFAFFIGGGTLLTIIGGLAASPLAALIFAVVLVALVAYAAYLPLLPARTAMGSAIALRTESFRRFLVASEGRHVEWAWKQGLLREYSAWAVALGAAEAWRRSLRASSVPEVEYSHGPLLVYSMASAFSHSHTAPSSSGSGGGFSGGGFSGGSVGGGGGGGSSGSW